MKRVIAVVAALVATCVMGHAQGYPDKPIKIVVPFAPGGIVDFAGRALAQRLEVQMGQPVLVENRTTSGAIVGTASVANAQPDGYTLLVVDPSVVINPAMMRSPAYQMKQFKTIATLTTAPLIVVVNPTLPVSNLRELIEYSKKTPGGITYASAGAGTTTHLGPELLKVQTGMVATHVPYRGGGASLPDLISGRVHAAMFTNAVVLPSVNNNRLRAIAQTGSRRAEANSDVPTGVEGGYKDFVVELWTGLFAPVGLPDNIAQRLASEVKTAVSSEEFKKAIRVGGVEVLYKDPVTAAAFVEAEQKKWEGLIQAANVGEK